MEGVKPRASVGAVSAPSQPALSAAPGDSFCLIEVVENMPLNLKFSFSLGFHCYSVQINFYFPLIYGYM